MTYAKGIDVSKWQDNNATPKKIDWQKARDAGNDFVFIRAAYAGIVDEDFAYNWPESKTIPLRGVYQFYDYRIDAKKQADFLVTLMAGDWGELPPVIDVEEPAPVYNKDTKQYDRVPFPKSDAWTSEILEWLGIIEAACGKKPVIYTSQNYIKYGLKMSAFSPLLKYPLWIAEYRTPPTGTPYIHPWKEWAFWQWGTPPVGLISGVESKEVDSNFFNGTVEDLRKFCGITEKPPELTLEQRVERIEKHLGLA